MLKPSSAFYSTSVNAAPALLSAVEKAGGDGDEIVRRAGLPYSAGAVRSRSVEGISRENLTSLYRECVLFLESDTCTRDHRPQWPTENYEIVCFCLIGCPNLSEVLARTRDFFDALAASQCEISISMSRDITTFSLNSHRQDAGPSAFITDLVGTASFQRLFSWLIGENLPVIESGTIYPESLWEPVMASIAPPGLRFGQASSYFSFPSAYLNKRLVRSYTDVSNMRGAIPWTFMLPMDYADDLPSTVRVLLNSSLHNGDQIPDLNQLARKLGCSTRTLRRRLSSEAISLTTLKNECRLEIATDLLRNSSLTIEQIASRVSLSDAIVFRRAFKRWTGVSPSDYRYGMHLLTI
jgi:AraC-like DNA-binding protein